MGTQYSQPPRGYLYSDRRHSNSVFSGMPAPLFGNFAEMFTNDIKYEKDLPFIITKTHKYTYIECLKVVHELKSIFDKSMNKKTKVKILFYCAVTGEIMILVTCSLILGCEVVLASKNKYDAHEIIKNMESVDAIVCEPENIQSFSNKFKSALIIENGIKGRFTTVKQIIDNGIGRQTNVLNEEIPHYSSESIVLLNGKNVILGYYNMIYLDEWSDKMKICRDTKITSLLSIDDNLGRLLLFLTVYNRCSISFCDKLEEVKDYNSYYLLLSIWYWM